MASSQIFCYRLIGYKIQAASWKVFFFEENAFLVACSYQKYLVTRIHATDEIFKLFFAVQVTSECCPIRYTYLDRYMNYADMKFMETFDGRNWFVYDAALGRYKFPWIVSKWPCSTRMPFHQLWRSMVLSGNVSPSSNEQDGSSQTQTHFTPLHSFCYR